MGVTFTFGKLDYCVYKLINHSKKKIYYGITNNFKNRYEQHASNNVVATKMWVFGIDNIEHQIVEEGLSKENASEKAHSLSKANISDLLKYPGYESIETGGW